MPRASRPSAAACSISASRSARPARGAAIENDAIPAGISRLSSVESCTSDIRLLDRGAEPGRLEDVWASMTSAARRTASAPPQLPSRVFFTDEDEQAGEK